MTVSSDIRPSTLHCLSFPFLFAFLDLSDARLCVFFLNPGIGILLLLLLLSMSHRSPLAPPSKTLRSLLKRLKPNRAAAAAAADRERLLTDPAGRKRKPSSSSRLKPSRPPLVSSPRPPSQSQPPPSVPRSSSSSRNKSSDSWQSASSHRSLLSVFASDGGQEFSMLLEPVDGGDVHHADHPPRPPSWAVRGLLLRPFFRRASPVPRLQDDVYDPALDLPRTPQLITSTVAGVVGIHDSGDDAGCFPVSDPESLDFCPSSTGGMSENDDRPHRARAGSSPEASWRPDQLGRFSYEGKASVAASSNENETRFYDPANGIPDLLLDHHRLHHSVYDPPPMATDHSVYDHDGFEPPGGWADPPLDEQDDPPSSLVIGFDAFSIDVESIVDARHVPAESGFTRRAHQKKIDPPPLPPPPRRRRSGGGKENTAATASPSGDHEPADGKAQGKRPGWRKAHMRSRHEPSAWQ